MLHFASGKLSAKNDVAASPCLSTENKKGTILKRKYQKVYRVKKLFML